MSEPKKAVTTGVLAAVKLPEQIPEEKRAQMAGSVVAGGGLILLGLVPMGISMWILAVRLVAGDVAIATLIVAGSLFGVGLLLVIVGANIASNQVVKNGLLQMKEPLEMALRFWRAFRNGRNGSNGGTPHAG